jgi:hypothetical protein
MCGDGIPNHILIQQPKYKKWLGNSSIYKLVLRLRSEFLIVRLRIGTDIVYHGRRHLFHRRRAIDIGSNVVGRAHSSSRAEPAERPVRRVHAGREHWPSSARERDLQARWLEPPAYLTAVIARIVISHPNSRIDGLLP